MNIVELNLVALLAIVALLVLGWRLGSIKG